MEARNAPEHAGQDAPKVVHSPFGGDGGSAAEAGTRPLPPGDIAELFQRVMKKATSVHSMYHALATPASAMLFVLFAVQVMDGLGAAVALWASALAETEPASFIGGAALHVLLIRITAVGREVFQALGGASRTLLVAVGAWAVMRIKHAALIAVEEELQEVEPDSTVEHVGKALVGVSGLLSWIILGGAALSCFNVLGVDIRPFLALGGVSGLVAGFAAQSVLTNILAGVQIFLARPFAVGERIELSTNSGGRVIEGVVMHIAPTRTVLRNDADCPVSIPNKTITDLMVTNLSRAMTTWGVSGPPPKPVEVRVPVRLEDTVHANTIAARMKTWLHKHPLVDHRQPVSCGWAGFTSLGKTELSLRCVLAREGVRKYGTFREELLKTLLAVLTELGAQLS
ncbi:unnamed protein product [Pedinophyceae sp. YPF-701]|nr:unnamed protein product [Pedinophyceae sp. YPF-701]